MIAEKLTGTKAVAQRMVNAHENLVANLAEIGGISPAEAEKAAAYYIKHKIVRMDAVGGRYLAKHGMFMDCAVIRRASKT